MTAVASADPQRGCGTGMVLMCAPTLHTAPPHWAYSAYSRQYMYFVSIYIHSILYIYTYSGKQGLSKTGTHASCLNQQKHGSAITDVGDAQ